MPNFYVGNPLLTGDRWAVGNPTVSAASDTIPDAFTLGTFTDVALGATVLSNTVIVSGIDTATIVSVTGGSFRINMGTPSTDPGVVSDGDLVEVLLDASSSASTQTSATLNIGGVTDTMLVTTGAADETPDAFDFGESILTAASTANVESSVATVTGIDSGVVLPVTFSGDASLEWSKNGGTWSTGSTTVVLNDTLQLRLDAGAAGSARSGTAAFGGLQDTFTVVAQLASAALSGGGKSGSKRRILQHLK